MNNRNNSLFLEQKHKYQLLAHDILQQIETVQKHYDFKVYSGTDSQQCEQCIKSYFKTEIYRKSFQYPYTAFLYTTISRKMFQ